jgi:hypothetical protein
MKCSSCGTENTPEYKYCASCGTPLHVPVATNQIIDSHIPVTQRHDTATAQRKPLSGLMLASIFIGALSTVALCLCIIGILVIGKPQSTNSSSQLPTFKVTGRSSASLSLLVPENTTDEQLAGLIHAFRQARKDNSFGRIGIPATTSNSKYGNYAFIDIYIFTESDWASESNLKRSFAPAMKNDPFIEEYSRHIKAWYLYSAEQQIEEGSVGYEENGKVYSSTYRKLF